MTSSIMKIGQNYFLRDLDSGTYPILSLELNRRVKNKEACIVAVVGEAGISKSYTAIQIARNIDPRFRIQQIVFTYSEYCRELARNKPGLPIVFDEPSYAMGKREWYKQINQALVKTIESQRFLVRPLIIPIININLLDKTLRDYLIVFQVHITGRGKALVYRIRASQGQDKIYRYLICRLEYPILDFEKCKKEEKAKKKNKSSCLECRLLNTCNLLRAQYERKKESIQLSRYKQDEERAKQREAKEFTNDQLIAMIRPYLPDCIDNNKVIATKLRSMFYVKLGIKIGNNKAYALKSLIELRNITETQS
ncbi:MAG: hypothetical protein ACFFDN_51680 [Candidatus Hodarchaeota archaeon]